MNTKHESCGWTDHLDGKECALILLKQKSIRMRAGPEMESQTINFGFKSRPTAHRAARKYGVQ